MPCAIPASSTPDTPRQFAACAHTSITPRKRHSETGNKALDYETSFFPEASVPGYLWAKKVAQYIGVLVPISSYFWFAWRGWTARWSFPYTDKLDLRLWLGPLSVAGRLDASVFLP